MALTNMRYPVYEPTSDCVLFVKGYAVCSLDSNNVVDVVAGNIYTPQETVCISDGYRREACFSAITALAPDGKGSVYVAEAQRIRKVDLLSGQVTTLPGSVPRTGSWTGLSYDDDADALFATTASVICRIDLITLTTTAASAHVSGANGGERTTPMDTAAGELEAKVNLVAGDWQAAGNTDGPGTIARFTHIIAILAGVHRQLYILDHDKFRIMSASGYVNTALPGLPTDQCSIAALPSGELAVGAKGSRLTIVRGPQLGPSSPMPGGIKASHSAPRQRPSAALSKLHRTLLLCAAGADVNPATVNIHTRDGTVFVAHRSALVSHSQYFEKLLVPGGGFADSGAEDVKLPDADPAAFQWLLAYMYTGELYMPDKLLRPAVLLADRLLMPQDCVGQLQKWLLAKVTPQSVLSDLVWAEQHGMTSLVPQLKLRLLRQRKSVVLGEEDLRQLIVHCPCLAADLIREPVAFRDTCLASAGLGTDRRLQYCAALDNIIGPVSMLGRIRHKEVV
ncbi:hypothetical protein VOLCADRAFT_86429 [Volvox carteri f. nagariensis]|uniref:BTB domain-containing protein n=1 Tax=Volvox carteri f. nagariensis TaxID=3068 RepID=D8TIR6_VOLCA|nr:uncharacterized protein VOLCADRAFT_86429 [Volvox carteri f. nagariensis]EFJ53290.1 hypothetical protein VOLCADRAFT_86429 [Volvox carteri f. nagariensis]|eukprot:XP_002946295.1 hypothetical protein VOLCADRAFT_86429 [Volvox carteri f. nagariensis]